MVFYPFRAEAKLKYNTTLLCTTQANSTVHLQCERKRTTRLYEK